jgi:ATP-dependent RNA helicase DeaD
VLFVTPRERRMLMDIERFTGQRIAPMKMPTAADVAARRTELFKENLRRTIAEGDLDLYLALVEGLVEEGFDISEVAAAAAALARRDRPLEAVIEPEPVAAGGGSGAEGGRWGGAGGGAGGGMARLFLNAGRQSGVRPADIVGAIANEAGVPGKEIGAIDIDERFSLVEVPARYQQQILERMAGITLRGRTLAIRVAGEADEGSRTRQRPGKPAGAPVKRPPYKKPPKR